MTHDSLQDRLLPLERVLIDAQLESRPARSPAMRRRTMRPWLISRPEAFDAEDPRLMTGLSAFASAAFTTRASVRSAPDAAAALSQANDLVRRLERRF